MDNTIEEMVARIRALAPKLSKKDVEDLMTLSADELSLILSDYISSKRLNRPQIRSIIKFLNSFKPLVDLVSPLAEKL